MKKLIKSDLKGLSETMDLIPQDRLGEYVCAYRNDCFWMAMAKINDGGTIDQFEADELALVYFTAKYEAENAYVHLNDADGAAINFSEAKWC